MRGRTVVVAVSMGALVVPQGTIADAAALRERGQVVSAFVIPTTSSEARSLGRDVDGDGERDNALGSVFASLTGQGMDVAGAQAEALASGDIVLLHSLRTRTLANTRNATWQVLHGVPTAEPDHDGGGTFEVSTELPRSAPLDARIRDHVVRTVPGRVPVQLDLGASSVSPMVLSLRSAVVTATCRRTGCTRGRIGGGVATGQVDGVLLPYLAALFTEVVQRDCPGAEPSSCTPDSQGETIQAFFDADDDMVVTTVELQESTLMTSLLAPDLDLTKADGRPGRDGENDAISFGIGFATVPARLSRS